MAEEAKAKPEAAEPVEVSRQSVFSTHEEKVTPNAEDANLTVEILGQPRKVADPFSGK